MSGPGTGKGSRQDPGGAAVAVLAVVVLAAGLVVGRPDVAVLGVPLAAVAVLALRRTPGGSGLDVEVHDAEGGALAAVLRLHAAAGMDLAVVQGSAYGEPPRTVVVSAARARELRALLPVLHSGPQEVLHVSVLLVSAGAGSTELLEPATARLTVEPAVEQLDSLILPRRISGRPGGHPARRAGDGSDFWDLSPLRPGDRLRRIDWRATARLGRSDDELFVRRAAAAGEATAVVALDSRDDVGARVVEWGRNRPAQKGVGSLDVARAAVGAISAAYLAAGDRVAFLDLVHAGSSVRTGGGRRQLDRIRAVVAETVARPDGALRSAPLQAGAVVLLLSTFLDDAPVARAAVWVGGDHRVVAVDVLPDARLDGADERTRLAHRIVQLERTDRFDRLRGLGVTVVRWNDPQRDLLLAAAARMRTHR